MISTVDVVFADKAEEASGKHTQRGGVRPDDEGSGGGGGDNRGGDENMTVEEYRPVRDAVLRALLLPSPRSSG